MTPNEKMKILDRVEKDLKTLQDAIAEDLSSAQDRGDIVAAAVNFGAITATLRALETVGPE